MSATSCLTTESAGTLTSGKLYRSPRHGLKWKKFSSYNDVPYVCDSACQHMIRYSLIYTHPWCTSGVCRLTGPEFERSAVGRKWEVQLYERGSNCLHVRRRSPSLDHTRLIYGLKILLLLIFNAHQIYAGPQCWTWSTPHSVSVYDAKN